MGHSDGAIVHSDGDRPLRKNHKTCDDSIGHNYVIIGKCFDLICYSDDIIGHSYRTLE